MYVHMYIKLELYFSYNTCIKEQHLISCANTGCYGCSGGWPQYAMDYLMEKGNVVTKKYPYTSGTTGQSETCKAVKTITKWKAKSYFELYADVNYGWNTFGRLTPGNCTRLKQLLSKGPVQVNFQVYGGFYQYKSGVYVEPDCPTYGTINHAFVAVAYIKNYQKKKGNDVIMIRNSWGTEWGENGYGYISIANNTNTCGICSWLTYLPPTK